MSPTTNNNSIDIPIATLKNIYSNFSKDVINCFIERLEENEKKSVSEKCLVYLDKTLQQVGKSETIKQKKEKKEKFKKRKNKIPIPFCGIIETTWCCGIKKNHNLYTQCPKPKESGQKYCKICAKHANNSSTGKPPCGDIYDRKLAWDIAINNNQNPIAWRPDGMTQELPYINVADKLGISTKLAQQELDNLGWGDMPNYHLEKKKVRRGRPAKNKVAVEDSDDDTPKKKRGRPKKTPKKEPTNDELIALMTEALA